MNDDFLFTFNPDFHRHFPQKYGCPKNPQKSHRALTNLVEIWKGIDPNGVAYHLGQAQLGAEEKAALLKRLQNP